jgi:hypothetical protein
LFWVPSASENEKQPQETQAQAHPSDAPQSRGKEVELHIYDDSDHAGEKLTRRSCKGFYLNEYDPEHLVFKRQPTIEMHVFGAGLVVMKNEMEATRELWISYARAWKA